MKIDIKTLPWMILLLCMTCQLLGYAVFLRGFLALKAAVPGHATWTNASFEPTTDDDSKPQILPPTFGRLVFVLIDALRADFVLPTSKSSLPRMKFVSDLIEQNKTLSFLAKAHPPTVTLPRLKALTTGGIPGFMDVVLNFDSAALQEDNLISQFKHAKKEIVFYGDDTWMRLFPEHFKRSDGTTSFFVTDYTEVDDNVTRHVGPELSGNDWDVLVLHYLGLDHIGHLAGPYSPLVGPKLQEMDHVIKTIHETLSEQDESHELPSLLVLCGDHGMSDHGSHGGSSVNEVNTPIIFMSSRWAHATGEIYKGQEVEQIDAVPTLAQMLGVPIPQNSLGITMLPALVSRPLRHQLAALHLNSKQVLGVFQQNVATYQNDPAYIAMQRAISAHGSWLSEHLGGATEMELGRRVLEQYVQALRAVRSRVATSLTVYDLHAMGTGIVLLWLAFFSLILGFPSIQKAGGHLVNPSTILLFLLSVWVLSTTQVLLCTGKYGSPLLCNRQSLQDSLVVVMVILASACIAVLFHQISSHGIFIPKGAYSSDNLPWFLLVGTVIHTLSLLASSFVEEEHQTWYFFTLTAHLLLARHLLVSGPERHLVVKDVTTSPHAGVFSTETNSNAVSQPCAMDKDRVYMQTKSKMNQGSLHRKLYEPKEINSTSPEKTWDREHVDYKQLLPATGQGHIRHKVDRVRSYDKVSLTLALGCVVSVSRIARVWNRTGDKWAHLPDIGDWLVRPDNKSVLSWLTAVSLAVVCVLQCRGPVSWGCRMILIGGAISIYCFRAANGAIYFPGFYQGVASKGVFEARISYSIIGFVMLDVLYTILSSSRQNRIHEGKRHLLQSHGRGRSTRTIFLARLQVAWTLLMLLLLRPHNSALVAMVILIDKSLTYCCNFMRGVSVSTLTLLYLWMGQACFFYQGNSNSISTVDVSAGYVGLDDYQPVVIGLLMCLTTYAGPIFWFISLAVLLSRQVDEGKIESWGSSVDSVSFTLALSRTLPLAVYTCLVTLQRFHLFVWTVFSPKLLYEGMYTLVISVVILTLQLMRHPLG